jgi:nucleotide-binding universal stress UspA family protein
MYSKILVVLQGKPGDAIAAHHALDLALTFQAKLTLLRVITIMGDGPKALGTQFQTEIGSSGWHRKQAAARQLASIQADLQSKGVPIETAIVVGDRSHADEILIFADQGDYDLIVMVSDVHSWLKCLLYDCPVYGVQRKSRVPVLFVKSGEPQARPSRRVIHDEHKVLVFFGEPCI